MTPHERAKKLVAAWNNNLGSGRDGLVSLVTTALQAQSNEDEARHREQQAALRDLLAQQSKRADEAEAERDTLAAHNAVLREALEAVQSYWDSTPAILGDTYYQQRLQEQQRRFNRARDLIAAALIAAGALGLAWMVSRVEVSL